MVKAKGTILKDVLFNNCKMVGFPFHDCNALFMSFKFKTSQLNFASFHNLKLKNTTFDQCKLEQTDFTEADLSGSKFDDCNLLRAIFEHTNLEHVNFSNSYNLSINPELNKLKNAKFSKENALGLLNSYQIKIED
ncbi:pentapeptide repeat-containing protein [uncultured Psychroserpens sp.]|nr:pentapeptide repeat-containing protein [uncultured Psychroserpens sp.]